jgi:hypothetical protein
MVRLASRSGSGLVTVGSFLLTILLVVLLVGGIVVVVVICVTVGR